MTRFDCLPQRGSIPSSSCLHKDAETAKVDLEESLSRGGYTEAGRRLKKNPTFYDCISRVGFLPREIRVAFPMESRLRQSGATQQTVHARCFSVSIIHRTLTWTTGSLPCELMLIHGIAHGGVRTHVRESALKVDSGRKIPCRNGESNLRQRRDGPML